MTINTKRMKMLIKCVDFHLFANQIIIHSYFIEFVNRQQRLVN